jgi:hypothetical protein
MATRGPDDSPAVERVRAELARLGADAASAPAVPPSVTDRVVSALRAASAHGSKRARAVRVGAVVGATAAIAATGLGTAMLVASHGSPPARPEAQHLGAEPASVIPLSDAQLAGLLSRPPDLGPLADSRRRSSCLSGLGYPGSAAVLGGAQVGIRGSAAVVLLLAGGTPDTIAVLAVRPNCSAADTGLVADTQIRRP